MQRDRSDPLPFDPEPERTFRRRRAQQRLAELATMEGQQLTPAQIEARIEAQVLERLAQRVLQQEQQDATRSLRDLTSATMSYDYPGSIAYPTVAGVNFELRPGFINMVNQNQYGGSALEDPHAHLERFIRVCNTFTSPNIPAISTTSLSLDACIGVGGIPRGRIIEIYGPEASGKTTLALHIVAEAQKVGDVAAYIDAEHAMDSDYAGKLGVNIEELLISQPDSGEQALEIAEALVRSNGVGVLVIDSVAALVPRAEFGGDKGDSLPALQARLMSQALRKLTAIVGQTNTCLIFINQIREKIGVMFGSPETTTGGRALKFYSSVRLDIRRIGAIKDGDRVVGNRTKVKIVKNKVAPPFRECEFDIMYGEGISREGDVLDLAVTNRVVEKSGAWFSYGGERLGQGRENSKTTLRENPEMRARIENDVKKALGMPVHREEAEKAEAAKK